MKKDLIFYIALIVNYLISEKLSSFWIYKILIFVRESIKVNNCLWSRSLSCTNGGLIMSYGMEYCIFSSATGKKIAIQRNFVIDATSKNYMKQMSKFNGKYGQFKTRMDMNKAKLNTFWIVTAHLPNDIGTKWMVYSWGDSNRKILCLRNIKKLL